MSNPSEDSLRTLLVELNNRSRMYASRFWQIPFAYLGTTGGRGCMGSSAQRS